MSSIKAVNDFVIKFANVNGSGPASANDNAARHAFSPHDTATFTIDITSVVLACDTALATEAAPYVDAATNTGCALEAAP